MPTPNSSQRLVSICPKCGDRGTLNVQVKSKNRRVYYFFVHHRSRNGEPFFRACNLGKKKPLIRRATLVFAPQ